MTPPQKKIKIRPSHRGLLHKKEGIPAGKPIPEGTLMHDLHSKSEKLRKEAQFAENAKHWNHSR